MSGLLDTFTGGESSTAKGDQEKALALLQGTYNPDAQDLSLPELEQYALQEGIDPAEMKAFLQDKNAYNDENIDQTGTDAQIKALGQLADVANAGADGTATERAQVEKINQDAGRNLAGQRGAIDQQAQARGVPVGLLQAALQSQRAGEGQQDAHMAALDAQSAAYQQALDAMAKSGVLGGQVQGQQNTQANTVAGAQNAMQQFNAANQQAASATNAGFKQQANVQNAQNANQIAAANTGLANERTRYNTQVPETIFQNQMQKNGLVANQFNNASNVATGQGQQNAGITGGLLGTAGTIIGGMYGGPAGAALGGQLGNSLGSSGSGGSNGPPASANTDQYRPYQPTQGYGNATYASGGVIPGKAHVPGDSPKNDTVPIRVSPGEAVVPRSVVQQNPVDVMRLLAGRPASVPHQGEPLPQPGAGLPGHHPQDVAALLAAMKHMRGAM